jgi:ABC-type cobalamin/Fe3+-siderophores transport system ATPase subunit
MPVQFRPPAPFIPYCHNFLGSTHKGVNMTAVEPKKKIEIPGIAAPVDGEDPIVIIGPNGVGKTRLGVTITQKNSGERVAALRNVEIPEIPLQRFAQASQQVKNALAEVLSQHWRQSFELQNLMSEILAEDRELAVKYRDEREKSSGLKLDEKLTNTRLRRIVSVWNRHFPGRIINIDYEPKVRRIKKDGSVAEYSIAQMSEGERTALYLTARVVSCQSTMMVVDEPETFFHPLLARNLWNDLETEAPKIRFVYITHDIPFALSRKGARFAIARSEDAAELLPPTSSIPNDVIADVLGAASFAISASRLIFCEGTSDSLDIPILSAWHNCPKTAVVPVGGCNAVRECVSVFRGGQVTGGVDAFGYVDRDGWPDAQLAADPHVKAHAVSEIEGLFCLEPVFKALAKYNGSDETQANGQFNAFMAEARGAFKDITYNKEILARAKLRVETEQKAMLNPLKPDHNSATMRAAFASAQPPGGWPAYLTTVFSEEEARLSGSLGGNPLVFVRDFPAKSYVSTAAKHLGFVKEKMIEVFCKALRLTDEEAKSEQTLKVLRDAIVSTIEPYLWLRKV